MHDLLHDVTHEFLHVDSKIFRTVKHLLLTPGFLTREYFNGRRTRYVSPIRIYLVFSVIYFAATALIERPTFRSDESVEVHNTCPSRYTSTRRSSRCSRPQWSWSC
jgi:hypothetical protein